MAFVEYCVRLVYRRGQMVKILLLWINSCYMILNCGKVSFFKLLENTRVCCAYKFSPYHIC